MRFVFFLMFFLYSSLAFGYELCIHTVEGVHYFKTDIADTPELQEKGLMYKKYIPINYAMTFLFEKPKIIRMWMKNTFIPLDMIFFDENGIITHLKENAIPHDLTHISSRIPAKGVIEINAGLIQQKKIKIGDKITLK